MAFLKMSIGSSLLSFPRLGRIGFSWIGILWAILLSAIAISLALAATLRFCTSRERVLITCALTGFSIVSILLLITVAAKAITSANRNYETFARQLRNKSNLAGIVLIDDPAWLALREITGRDQLVHIAGYANHASRSNKAVILSSPGMAPL